MRDDRLIGVEDQELDDAALVALAEAYATPAPPLLRERLLGAARRDSEVGRGARLLHRWRLVGSIAAGLAIAFGVLLSREARIVRLRTGEIGALARANAELSSRVEEQARDVAGLREALATQAQVLRVVGAPRTLTAALNPNRGAAGTGRVVVDAGSGEAAIVLAGLPPAGADKVYELWAIRGDNPPEPAGLLAVPAEQQAFATRLATVPRPLEVSAFAVSIEPTGGSASPTGPIVLLGPVSS